MYSLYIYLITLVTSHFADYILQPGNEAQDQSVETWLGDRRVAGSSPATDHNMESGPVAGEVPVHFLGYCRGALEQGTKTPMCSLGA